MISPLSGLIVLCGAALVGACLIAAAALPKWAGGWVAALCAAGAAAATGALFVGIVLTSRGHLGDMRVTLARLSFAFERESERVPVTFGGSRERDDVVIAAATPDQPRMHDSALAVTASPDRGSLVLEFNAPAREGGLGVVLAAPEARGGLVGSLMSWIVPAEPEVIGALPFDRTVALCLPRNGGGVDAIGLAPDGARLVWNGTPAAFTLTQADGAEVFVRHHAIHRAPAVAAAPHTGPSMPATRSVLLRRAGGWRLVILDRAAYLGSPDCAERRTPANHARLSLQPGGERHVSFQALQVAEDWEVGVALDEGAAVPESRLVERRGMTLRMVRADEGTDRLDALLDTPESLRIAAAPGNQASSRGGTLISFGAGLDPAVRGDLAGARFRVTGDRLADQFVQRLDLSRGQAALVGHERQAIGNGGSFSLGGTDSAALSLHRLDLDWQPLRGVLLLGVAGLAAGLAATFGWRTRSRYAFILLALTDFLLAFRLLAGIEAAVIDPRPSIVAGVAQSILAIALVPYLLTAFAPASVKQAAGRWSVVAHSLLIIGILLHLVLFNGLAPFSQAVVLLAPFALIAFAARLWPARGTRYAQSALAFADWIAARMAALADRVATRAGRVGRRTQPAPQPDERPAQCEAGAAEPAGVARFAHALRVMLICSLLLAVRIVLPERILILTAAVYMPLCIAYGAFSFHEAARALSEGAGSVRQWLGWSVLLVLPALYPAAAMPLGGGDPGFTVVSLWSIVVFGALLRLWVRSSRKTGFRPQRFVPVVPLVLAAAAMFYIAVMPVPLAASNWPDPTDETQGAKQERIAQVRNSLERERFQQRLLAWVAPERFADAGTREAQELRVALRHMAAYSNQGHFGRGFLNQPEPTELRRYQLTDNGAAVHLLAPFGRVGAAMFLLVLGIAAAGATRRLCRTFVGKVMSFSGLLALFSLWTLFSTSSYMVLANMQVVPFTGRNVYLLAANSPSDLLEAFALLAMALCGLVRSSG